MAICIDCIHGDVCRNAYSLIVEPPNVCGNFKNKEDVVEVVRCFECKNCVKKGNTYECEYFVCADYGRYEVEKYGYCHNGWRKEDGEK